MAANTNNQQQTQPQVRPIALQQISHWLLSVIEFTLRRMRAKLHSWRLRIKHPVRLAVIIGAALLWIGFLVVIVLGYKFNWHWTGLVPETSAPLQHAKTLWDWLQLLIIPLMLAIGGFWLNQVQKSREQRAIDERAEREKRETEQRAKTEREAAEQRAKTEREIAADNQREAALQAYLDKMSE